MEEFKDSRLPMLRKYLTEAVIMVLCIAVGFLFRNQRDLEEEFRKHLISDSEKMIQVISENNQILSTYKR